MSDPQGTAPQAASDTRLLVILCYALFILVFTNGLTSIVGVVLAYIKRSEVRGTIWESHFDNIINTFWVTLVAGIAFGILVVFVIGIPLLFALAIWFLYRSIKGLVRAIDNKAYF